MIDYPLLAPELTDGHVAAACRLAREWNIGCLVVRPSDVEQAVRWMDGSGIPVGSVAGYPTGISVTGTKLYEGRDLLRRGAREIEFYINVGKMISRQFQYVETELLQIANSCAEVEATLKINLASEFLDNDLRIIATKICKRVRADMMSIAGAEEEFVVMRPIMKERIGVKIASGVTTLGEALQARTKGASRFNTSAVAQILTDWKAHLEAQKQQNAPAVT